MSSPPLVPASREPGPSASSPAPLSRRSSQVALASFLFLLVGLLLFRGYGNRLGARPTETVDAPRMLLDLNAAESGDLEQVPGIGPKLARALDEHRKANGPFRNVDDLRAVHGFGPAAVDKLRPFVKVGPAAEASPAEPLVLVRKPPAAVPAASAASRAGVRKLGPGDPPIDVNAASTDELQRLPGVGPAMAKRIADRRADAPFRSADDLRKVKGIGAKTLEALRPYVVAR